CPGAADRAGRGSCSGRATLARSRTHPMSATSIARILGRRVFDSRGRPTVEAEVALQGRATGRAIAPAGASRGTREAVDPFGGGAHAGRRIDIQDLMVMPIGAQSLGEALAMVADIYRAAGALMQDDDCLAGVADEGGYWPQFESNEAALTMLVRAIERAGLR